MLLQRRLAEMRKVIDRSGMTAAVREERERILTEIELLDVRNAEFREREKDDARRRNFAGIGLPFWQAVREGLGEGPALTRFEVRALEIFADRERRSAAHRAQNEVAKGGKRPPQAR